MKSVVFSGGCSRGVQAVFQHVKGVADATSGYSGGSASTATYDQVSTGETGHAESVKVTFNPAQVSFGQLLKVFFSVAHDPTELDHQGPDDGTNTARWASFTDGDQKSGLPSQTSTSAGPGQDLPPPDRHPDRPPAGLLSRRGLPPELRAKLHPDNPYIAINDAPKVAHLKKLFPHI